MHQVIENAFASQIADGRWATRRQKLHTAAGRRVPELAKQQGGGEAVQSVRMDFGVNDLAKLPEGYMHAEDIPSCIRACARARVCPWMRSFYAQAFGTRRRCRVRTG